MSQSQWEMLSPSHGAFELRAPYLNIKESVNRGTKVVTKALVLVRNYAMVGHLGHKDHVNT